MTQTMPDKLRLIADAIEQGKTVEYTHPLDVENGITQWDILNTDNKNFTFYPMSEYRIKPDKPLVGKLLVYDPAGITLQESYPTRQSIELTPEVIQALKDAGIEW